MSDRYGVDFLRGIAMHAPDITETAEFYQNVWGLEPVESESNTVYFRGTGPEPYIYSLTNAADFGIDYINLGMVSRDRLEGLYKQLEKESDSLESRPEELATPGGGYGFTMRDPDNRLLRIVADVKPNTDTDEAFAKPSKVSHVVLNTVVLPEAEKFYTDTLGFRRSDYYDERMSFLRCNTDHHSIGLFQNAHSSVNHVAFEMPDINSFYAWYWSDEATQPCPLAGDLGGMDREIIRLLILCHRRVLSLSSPLSCNKSMRKLMKLKSGYGVTPLLVIDG